MAGDFKAAIPEKVITRFNVPTRRKNGSWEDKSILVFVCNGFYWTYGTNLRSWVATDRFGSKGRNATHTKSSFLYETTTTFTWLGHGRVPVQSEIRWLAFFNWEEKKKKSIVSFRGQGKRETDLTHYSKQLTCWVANMVPSQCGGTPTPMGSCMANGQGCPTTLRWKKVGKACSMEKLLQYLEGTTFDTLALHHRKPREVNWEFLQ